MEVDDVETKPEVLTEAPVSDPGLEIAVAGGEEAYLHPQGAGGAQIQRRFNVVLAKTVLEGLVQPWQMKRQRMSPRYTTCWAELPVAS